MTGNVQIDQLVRSLLQKESLEHCTLQELEQFAGRHPYFGAAQLLLAKKMQLEKSEAYPDQLQKTYLFFHNPLWVQQLLGETGNAVISKAGENGTTAKEPPANEINTPVADELAGNDQPETLPTASVSMAAAVPEPAPPFSTPEPGVESIQKPGGNTGELVFEPFHTVDYFASQGIKLKLEDKPQDKFGQQLKSFTDWLKTMKRLPATGAVVMAEPMAEKKVEQLAEHSLEEKEVLTEAMAEVWIKQGNPEKARDIYRKLSLLEPSKSAYFAAKIEALQKS